MKERGVALLETPREHRCGRSHLSNFYAWLESGHDTVVILHSIRLLLSSSEAHRDKDVCGPPVEGHPSRWKDEAGGENADDCVEPPFNMEATADYRRVLT